MIVFECILRVEYGGLPKASGFDMAQSGSKRASSAPCLLAVSVEIPSNHLPLFSISETRKHGYATTDSCEPCYT